jgi:chemotaxis protein methyltransferase CheR
MLWLKARSGWLRKGSPYVTDAHPLDDLTDGTSLAHAIVDTVLESLIILDNELRVIAASRSFYRKFKVSRQETQGQLLYELGNGQWDIPELRRLLEEILPHDSEVEAFEIQREFPAIGQHTMLLNARRVFREGDGSAAILLAIEDVSERRAAEREKDELLRQKDILLKEMRHRVFNSLQIIASILLLKARSVESDETRRHLEEAHQRVVSLASLQMHLEPAGHGEKMQVGPYLRRLCESLAESMVGGGRSLSVDVQAKAGLVTSDVAVSLGLITTELLMNSLKHAFPERERGEVVIRYESDGPGWTLSISDDGVGRQSDDEKPERVGLGTTIVAALALQLGAEVTVSSGNPGMTVTVSRAAWGNCDFLSVSKTLDPDCAPSSATRKAHHAGEPFRPTARRDAHVCHWPIVL